MPLPARQVEILCYLSDRKTTTTAGNVAREIKVSRRTALNDLRLLAGNRLVSVDRSTWPASWSLTDVGSALVAAANFGRDS